MSKKLVSLFLLSFLVLSFSGCGCKKSVPNYSMELEVWGLFDDQDPYFEAFANYQKLNKNIKSINYRKFSQDTYKDDLLEALASGKGPDVFLINNSWLPPFKDKVVPAPKEILSEQKFKNDFIDVVINDFLTDSQVYGVPLSVDSLALYYNKDMFNEAGITSPPENWDEFSEYSKRMTKIDNYGNIVKSGAALGTAYNINRSTDVLSLMMIQNGAQMYNPTRGSVAFDQASGSGTNIRYPGVAALDFYSSFAKRGSSNYSWNSLMHYSVDAFSENTLGMMINYNWQRETIIAKSPKLNFEVAPVPQVEGTPPVNYANYWSFVVAKNKISKNLNDRTGKSVIPDNIRVSQAWKFVKFLTVKPDQDVNLEYNPSGKAVIDPKFDAAKSYLRVTGAPSGRRDIINEQQGDSKIGVFAKQNLLAKSWYQVNATSTEAIFAEMIDQVNKGQYSTLEAVQTAARRVMQLR